MLDFEPTTVLIFLGFIFSIVVHECAHGLVAHWCGDDTAVQLGRITLNPISHIDPVMSILLPGFLLMASHGQWAFGGAKPVPVNPFNLRNPKRDMMWVAWAGPMSNVILAIGFALLGNVAFLVLRSDPAFGMSLLHVVVGLVSVNLLLAGFNLIPVPPLDGSKILAGLLPRDMAASLMRLEPYGMLIVGALVFSGATAHLLWPVGYAADWMLKTLIFIH
ncbi:MAG: site-2 protease family protein [Planctomycetes bacterium]|nr:site-2 protease family protein [Planctomycetota bacterium]